MPSQSNKPDSQAIAPKAASAKAGTPGADLRQERLARALRDNLKKRKAQQRQRAGEDEGGGQGGGA